MDGLEVTDGTGSEKSDKLLKRSFKNWEERYFITLFRSWSSHSFQVSFSRWEKCAGGVPSRAGEPRLLHDGAL